MSDQSPPLLIRAYRLLGHILSPFAPILLSRRAKRDKEDVGRLGERLGHAGHARPDGPLVWLHGASIGEALSALPFCERLIAETGATVLFTTGTVTSAKMLAKRLPHGAIHQFFPLDLPHAVDRFLDHWRPDLAVFVESEIWPCMLLGVRQRGISMALINARISQTSFRRWSFVKNLAHWLFSSFNVVTAQTDAYAGRLRALTGRPVAMPGNLKLDASAPQVAPSLLSEIQASIGDRPVFAAISTHAGEDVIILTAHLTAAERVLKLLTIIAPRHPERGDDIKALSEQRGLSVRCYSNREIPDENTDIWLLDTVGDLGLAYALAGPVFCGGSLIPHGGQTPIEAALMSRPILHGPRVFNFADIYAALDASGGAGLVVDADELSEAVVGYLGAPERLARAGQAALATLKPMSGATDRTVALIAPLLKGKRS